MFFHLPAHSSSFIWNSFFTQSRFKKETKSKRSSVALSHWTPFTNLLKSEHQINSEKNGNTLIFNFEITRCNFILISNFRFSLFLSEPEYRVQSPSHYQSNTDQTQRLVRAELLLVPSPPHNPLPKSVWSEFGRSLQIGCHRHQSVFIFLISS